MLPLRSPRTWIGIALGALVAAQLVPVDRSNPPVVTDLPAPPEVKSILERSCYACHSHETPWPWYGYVAPASWWLAHDVHEARKEMNFSTWQAYRVDKRGRLLKDAIEEIEEGEMPPRSYRLMHPEAEVGADELARLRAWVDGRGNGGG